MKSVVLLALLGLASGVNVEKRHRLTHKHQKPTNHHLVGYLDVNDFHDDNDLTLPMSLIKKMKKEQENLQLTSPTYGMTFVQNHSGSDPIHGSLGPPKSKTVFEPSAEAKLEADLRTYKPRSFTHDQEEVLDTEHSIKIAEKLTKGKMAEPFDVEKRDKKLKTYAPVVSYTIADSDDEDADTVETRKSLKTAEKMLQSRFFTNEGERKLYEKMGSDSTLREVVKEFDEKDDNITETEEEYKKRKESKKEDQEDAQRLRELQEEADKAKKKGEKDFLDEKVKKDLAAASSNSFLPAELQGSKL